MLGKCVKELRESQEQMVKHLQAIMTGDASKLVDCYREVINQQIIMTEAYLVLLKDMRRFTRSPQGDQPASPTSEKKVEKVEVE